MGKFNSFSNYHAYVVSEIKKEYSKKDSYIEDLELNENGEIEYNLLDYILNNIYTISIDANIIDVINLVNSLDSNPFEGYEDVDLQEAKDMLQDYYLENYLKKDLNNILSKIKGDR